MKAPSGEWAVALNATFSARLLPESNVEHDMHLRLSRYQVISPAIRDFNGNRRREGTSP